jgi:hypothetical protein
MDWRSPSIAAWSATICFASCTVAEVLALAE